MFTYISEHHPFVQIQLCPIYNKDYSLMISVMQSESQNPVMHDIEFAMQMSHKTRGLMNKSKTELSNHYMV